MYGRNGVDTIANLYTGISMACIIAALICMALDLTVVSLVIYAVGILFLFYVFFRIFSKNLKKRSEEQRKVDFFFKRISERDKYRYKKCPKCDSWLRFPKEKGKHKLDCPKCSFEIEVNIR